MLRGGVAGHLIGRRVRSAVVANPVGVPARCRRYVAQVEDVGDDIGPPRVAVAGASGIWIVAEGEMARLIRARRVRRDHGWLGRRRRGRRPIHSRPELTDLREACRHLFGDLVALPTGVRRAQLLQPGVAVIILLQRVFGIAAVLELRGVVEIGADRNELLIDRRAGRQQRERKEKCADWKQKPAQAQMLGQCSVSFNAVSSARGTAKLPPILRVPKCNLGTRDQERESPSTKSRRTLNKVAWRRQH
jgi:hypothetical protein